MTPAPRDCPWWLDRFSIVGQCVLVEGWAGERDFALWYDGVPMPFAVTTVVRPELAPLYAPGAEAWGFALCAALPFAGLDHAKFRLQINPRLVLDDPASRCARAEDQRFEAMTARFREEVAAGRGTLVELGARARSGNVYRGWFPEDIGYIGVDVREGPNVDVLGDAHHLSRALAPDTADFVFSIATFEHLLMPWKVALEMNRVMKDGALALIISHNAWPLHEEPWDFLRFSKESWSGFFNAHTGFAVEDAQYQQPASVVPTYSTSADLDRISAGQVFLSSGCLVRKVGQARVAWDAEVADVYDLDYSHA